jgi:hypothetical protein
MYADAASAIESAPEVHMKRSVAHSQLSVGVFVGLALLVSNHVLGCGDSSSATPEMVTASNNPGSQNNNNGSNAGSGGAARPTPNTEGNPGNIQLDPNRDQTVPINLVASGAVQCGGAGNYCVAPNLTCCTSAGMAGMMNSFSCAPNADACPAGTTSSTACSSAASCSTGQVCCRTGGGGNGGGATSTCEAACPMGSAQVCLDDAECGAGNQCNGNGTCGPVACTATSCGTGELCCRNQGGGGGNNVAACVAPGADSLCPNNQRQVCTTDADCPATFTCTPLGGGGGGGGGGGVSLCQPPPCTTTSCAMGQVCCVGGQVGGNPTCSAANAGVCPGNSRLLCVTDADCAPAAGTLCLPNPGGGGNGQLSCRVPPPPPAADAGAGDAGG